MDYKQSPNYWKGRAGHIVTGIVLHTIQGSAQSAVNRFLDPASQVSAHYVVAMDGSATQMVNTDDSAWHAGVQSGNTTMFQPDNPNYSTIGIEHDDGGNPAGSPRSDALYETSASIVAAAAIKYGIPLDRTHIVGHREIYNKKTCPGNLDMDRIIRQAQAIVNGGDVSDELGKKMSRQLVNNIWRGMHFDAMPNDDALNAQADAIWEAYKNGQDWPAAILVNGNGDWARERDQIVDGKIDNATKPLNDQVADLSGKLGVAQEQVGTVTSERDNALASLATAQHDLEECQNATPVPPTPPTPPAPVDPIAAFFAWIEKIFGIK